MKRLQRAAVLSELVKRMREHDSWCGETHLQKATYILQELVGVELGYDYLLYKHGPFSFDLREELGELVGDGLIRYQPQGPRYGPRITVTPQAENVAEIYPKTIARTANAVEFVAEQLDGRGVVDLERLATAFYVTHEQLAETVEERARMLRSLKPHITEAGALRAVREIDQIISEAGTLS